LDIVRIVQGEVKFQKDELSLIKEFKALFAKDKGSKGDGDGRKKLHTLNLFGIMYWLHHPLSPGIQKGDSGEVLWASALKEFGLHPDWKPSIEFEEASARYAHEINTGSSYIKLYKDLLRSFKLTAKAVELIIDKLETTINGDDLTDDKLTSAIKAIKEIGSIADDLPAKIKKLKESEILALEATKDKPKARGGKDVTYSMDPKHAVR